MKKKQKINKAVNYGEWILLGLTALFLCVLFALRERPAPERGITVRTASNRLPSGDFGNASAAPYAVTPESVPADAGNASAAPETDSAPAASETSPDPGSASGNPDDVSANADAAPYAVTPSGTPAVTPSGTPAVTPSGTPAASTVTPSGDAQGRVNLNTADLAELCALPGIGDALAGRIIAYREEHGPFARPEDVMRVSGIGQGKFDAMKTLITV